MDPPVSQSMISKKDFTNSYCINKKTIVYEKKKQWLKNHLVKRCAHCEVEFSFLIRKHHCRCCGKIFCDECSNNRIKIPDYIDKVVIDSTLKNIQNYISDSERVCRCCLTYIHKNIKMRKTMIIFNNMPLKIQDMYNLRGVCQNWKLIIDEYIKKNPGAVVSNDMSDNSCFHVVMPMKI